MKAQYIISHKVNFVIVELSNVLDNLGPSMKVWWRPIVVSSTCPGFSQCFRGTSSETLLQFSNSVDPLSVRYSQKFCYLVFSSNFKCCFG